MSTCARAVAALLLVATMPVAAQDAGKAVWEEYDKLVDSRKEVAKLNFELLGDSVDLTTGGLSFSATDASLPGNNTLPVAVTRSYAVSNHDDLDEVDDLPFADWDLDLPRLSGTFAKDWPNDRCTGSGVPPTQSVGSAYFNAWEYWDTAKAQMPGGGPLLRVNAATPKPADGNTYRWVTSGWTYFRCLSSIQDGPGEGFLAIDSNGTKYWFNRMAQYHEPKLLKKDEVSGQQQHLLRRVNVLYPTKIEDRFGNTVTLTFTNAWNAPARLSSIVSSDGRQITFTYNSRGHVATVDDGTRTWTYGYSYPTSVRGALTSVTQPDGRQWTIGFSQLSNANIAYEKSKEPGDFVRSCYHPGIVMDPKTATGTITHPSGATGSFTVTIKRHGRSNVPAQCGEYTLPQNDPNDDVAFYPINWDAFSLTSKTLSGPGLATQTWTYSYASTITYQNVGGSVPICYSQQGCGQPYCLSDTCAGTSVATVVSPGNKWSRYTFGNSYRYNEGKLLKVEEGSSGTNILRVTDHAYNLAQSGQPFPTPIGTGPHLRGDSFTSEYLRPEDVKVIQQSGHSFARVVFSFDEFARPLYVSSDNSLSFHKNEVTEYHDDLALWVIGQVRKVFCMDSEPFSAGCDGDVVSQVDYGWKALPWKTYSFGKLRQTITYDSTSTIASGQRGTVKTVSDGRDTTGFDTTITLTGWKRGIPQLVQYPATPDQASASQSAVVNNDGAIASVTDENGYKSCYAYDTMGRLSQITYPSETTAGTCNTSAWTATLRTFSFVAGVYGLPSHWRLWERTGNGYKLTHYDALWRPVVEEAYVNGDAANTRSIVVRRYDAAGRQTFQSYPVRTLGTWTDATLKGSRTTYDSLDRPLTAEQDSELGILTTTTEYLTGFQTRVTNPRGYQSTSGFQVFDSPDNATLAWTVRDAGYGNDQTIQIDRDPFGKPTRIRQYGSTWGNMADRSRHYVYDAFQQLCKTVEPETGATTMGYDGAGNLVWSAAGLNYPSTTACNATEGWNSGRRVERSYDARNRLKTLLFPDGRGNQAWNYTPDGLPSQVVTYNEPGGTMAVENTYTYNRRRLMTAETTAQSWYTWPIGYGYNANGHLASQVSPTNLTLTFTPNALGQPTAVQDQWGQTYASGVKYHPNGAVAQFNYGNGILHTMQQNVRQLPQRSTDGWGAMDYIYDYDDNGNPTLITDYNRGSDYSRWLVYDGLDRLTDAGSCSFGGDCWHRFDYDALDNLKSWKLAGVKDYANYYYDATNRLISIQNTAGQSIVGFGYDVQGNLQNKNGQGYDFDYGNRLRTVYNKEFYRYDGYGRRVMSWRQPGFTNLSMYSHGGQLVYQSDESKAKSFDYIYLAGSLVATVEYQHPTWASTIKFQHTDALGSPVAVSDGNGNVIDRTAWEPYGVAIGKPTYDGVGYSGHVMDGATGLTYMQQRYYDPAIGRFLSVDPVTAHASPGANFNRYWYANNNPYRFRDPDGRMPDVFGDLKRQIGGGGARRCPPACFGGGGSKGKGDGSGSGSDDVTNLAPVVVRPSSGAVPAAPPTESFLGRFGGFLRGLLGRSIITAPLVIGGDSRRYDSYLHYGYAADASKFAGGLRPGSYATKPPLMTGLQAQQSLALPHQLPPDSFYNVQVTSSVPVIGPMTVQPTDVPPRTGGGVEYIFPEGTPPGSVSGPYPLPGN